MNGSRIFKGGSIMRHAHKMKYFLGIALAAAIVLPGAAVFAQADSNNTPHSHWLGEGWGKNPKGRHFWSDLGNHPHGDGQRILNLDRRRGEQLAHFKNTPRPE